MSTELMVRPGVKQTLLRAAEVIEERGHSQGKIVSDTGGVCLYGALRIAEGLNPDPMQFGWPESEAVVMLVKHMPTHHIWGTSVNSVCDFNNSHSQEECVALLRETAGKLS